MQRRMQRRIRLVVEERRMSQARADRSAVPPADVETTVEITPLTALRPAPSPTPPPLRAVGRVAVRSA
jgi:hypothetical protein